jgi:hypothetical protein
MLVALLQRTLRGATTSRVARARCLSASGHLLRKRLEESTGFRAASWHTLLVRMHYVQDSSMTITRGSSCCRQRCFCPSSPHAACRCHWLLACPRPQPACHQPPACPQPPACQQLRRWPPCRPSCRRCAWRRAAACRPRPRLRHCRSEQPPLAPRPPQPPLALAQARRPAKGADCKIVACGCVSRRGRTKIVVARVMGVGYSQVHVRYDLWQLVASVISCRVKISTSLWRRSRGRQQIRLFIVRRQRLPEPGAAASQQVRHQATHTMQRQDTLHAASHSSTHSTAQHKAGQQAGTRALGATQLHQVMGSGRSCRHGFGVG